MVEPERGEGSEGQPRAPVAPVEERRPTLNAAVRTRRTDRAFFIRLAQAIRQNEQAIRQLMR